MYPIITESENVMVTEQYFTMSDGVESLRMIRELDICDHEIYLFGGGGGYILERSVS